MLCTTRDSHCDAMLHALSLHRSLMHSATFFGQCTIEATDTETCAQFSKAMVALKEASSYDVPQAPDDLFPVYFAESTFETIAVHGSVGLEGSTRTLTCEVGCGGLKLS